MFDWFVSAVGVYWLVSMIPCGFASIFISYGNKRIKIFDDQLCKELDKRQSYFYRDNAWRFMVYSVSYPFIRHRAKTTSKWFKVFMWVNSIHYYSWVVVFILAVSLHDLDQL
jgi:hypothetical protein